MEQDNHDEEGTISPFGTRVYSSEDLEDPNTLSLVWQRLGELLDKSKSDDPLTTMEKAEFDGMYPAWFHYMFDPI